MLLSGTHRRRHEREIWVVRNKRLRKYGQLYTLTGSAANRVAYALDCPGATREIGRNLDRGRFNPFHRLHRPGMNHHRSGFLVYQDDIQHIQWVDRPNTGDKSFLSLTVQRLG